MEAQKRPAGRGITEGVIWKQLLLFFFPILLGTFFQQLYNTADAMIVGKYVGKQALAAVGGATGNLINLIVGFFIGLASGGTVIISQFYGARQDQNVRKTVHTAIAMALCAGLFLTAAGVWLSPVLLKWMNTPEDVMAPAVTYIRIYFLGMVPSLIYNIGSGILRAVGDSRRPLFFLMAACMTNIVLDVLFVVGLDMGVAGAALATILSQAVSASLVLITLRRSHTACKLDFRQIRFHGTLLRRIIRIGLPIGLQSVMYSVSNVTIQSCINSFGTDITAAWSAWGRLDGFQWMVMNAFSISVTTFVGQNFGAQKFDRARRGVREGLLMSAGATVCISAILLLFTRPLFSIFTSEEAVIAAGVRIARLAAPYYLLYICVEMLSGAVRGAGESLPSTIFTLLGICVLRLVWVLVFVPMDHTIERTVFSYPLTWAVTSLMFIVYYLRGGWVKRCKARLITRQS